MISTYYELLFKINTSKNSKKKLYSATTVSKYCMLHRHGLDIPVSNSFMLFIGLEVIGINTYHSHISNIMGREASYNVTAIETSIDVELHSEALLY